MLDCHVFHIVDSASRRVADERDVILLLFPFLDLVQVHHLVVCRFLKRHSPSRRGNSWDTSG